MKLKALFIFLIFGLSQRAYSAWEKFPPNFPAINSKISEAIFISSANEGSNTRTPGVEMMISSYPALLHSVIITSGGINSQLEIFDASLSTLPTTNARRIANIDCSDLSGTQFPTTLLFDVAASSGLRINNGGDTPCRWSLIWREQ